MKYQGVWFRDKEVLCSHLSEYNRDSFEFSEN